MLRLTGGLFRGRTIQAPSHLKTRPTQAKLRQALFNSIQASIPDAKVLELFAGSGALGFEALSRGAQSVVYVESLRSAIHMIQKNAQSLGVTQQIRVMADAIPGAISKILPLGPFDIILADPPYAGDWETTLLNGWPWGELLSPDGCLCWEWGVQKSSSGLTELPDSFPFLKKVREKNYGDSVLTTYLRCDS